MVSLYEGYKLLNTRGKVTYFAGANTGDGFVGSYADIANEGKLDKVYIIKGGPGSGKSSMMRKIAAAAEAKGKPAEYYLCGSDPGSLDCVVIDGRIAVLDGTFPHVKDMKYPGAKSAIIDISKCWNDSTLEERKEEIVSHSALKSLEYSSAYRYLKAATQIELDNIAERSAVFNQEKADGFVSRFIKKLSKPSSDQINTDHRYTAGITMQGRARVATLYDLAETKYSISDSYGCSTELIKLMYNKLSTAGYSLIVGYLPLCDTISEIYIKDAGVTISAADRGEEARIINADRFVKKENLPQSKGKIKLASSCREECLNAALYCLNKAAEHHFSLEKIYIESMNFDKLNKLTEAIITEVLWRLAE
ncbi:MAG: hypothetical protein E7627_00535 [Ruminococcaceae bacterium]|nr:hypothetical protein [Oscillospiraceae bacterium]